MTQESLANCVGCSPVTIEKIESGERHPSRQIAELMATCLGVPDSARESFVKVARGELDIQVAEQQLSQPQSASSDNLPTPATPLLGREREVEAVRALLLQPDVRVVTLTGPGGVGKTRLSLGVAHAVAKHFRDGAYFVPLAPITDPELVPATIAQCIGLKDTGQAPLLDRLKRAMRDRHTLLLLDNLEQVVDASPLLADLLAWCPQLMMLATSREALRMRGERQFQVPPLPLPDLARLPDLKELASYPAIELFVGVARGVEPEFELTRENAGAVASICTRLDGLPLAIELAAARIRMLSPDEIAMRLNKRLSLLTGGARDLPARHRTLYDAVGWSYDLLDRGEQTLFARLSVFVGGFMLEAAESVCNAHADLPMDLLEGITSLVDKSLLRQEKGSGSGSTRKKRLTMLETIQEYARERLAELEGEEETQRLHAEYYLALVEAADPELTGAQQATWIERLEMERDNIRAALDWSERVPGRAELGLRVAGALTLVWQVKGRLGEGRDRLAKALDRASTEHTATRAKALFAAGWMALFSGDYPAARKYCEGSLEIEREMGNLWGVTLSLNGLGRVAEIERDFERAHNYYAESLAIRKALGNDWGVAGTLNNMGRAALRQGDYTQADSSLTESLALFRKSGDRGSTAIVLNNLALVALRCKEYERATMLFDECLTLELAVDYTWGIPYVIAGLAELACAREEVERAATLLAAAEANLEATGARMDPIDREDFDRNVAAARERLDVTAFEAAWERGRSMTLEQAIVYAR